MERFLKNNLPGGSTDEQFPSRSDDDKKILSISSPLQLTNLPQEVIHVILRNLKFGNIAKLRLVSKYFNDVCSFLLDTEFNYLRTTMFQRFQSIKASMPRRESARRKHPLARESDIIETLHMRLSLLNMTFGKHIEKKYCCFFPGEIIDEIYRILQYIENTPNLNRAYKVTDELFDLSTMAMEYFKEHIEPSLPEICFLTTNLLEHSSFIRPTTNWNIQKSQLLDLECSNTIQNILGNKPSKDPFVKMQEQLNKTNEIATKNRLDILKIRRSFKTVRKRVTAVEKELHQIKWMQKNCQGGLFPDNSKVKSLQLEIKEDLLASNSSITFPELNSSDTVMDKSNISSRSILENNTKETKPSSSSFEIKLFPDMHTTYQNDWTKNFPLGKRGNKRVVAVRDLTSKRQKRKNRQGVHYLDKPGNTWI